MGWWGAHWLEGVHWPETQTYLTGLEEGGVRRHFGPCELFPLHFLIATEVRGGFAFLE